MADLCFICNESSQGDPVNIVRGLKTLKAASIERNDGHIDFLNSSTPENIHTKDPEDERLRIVEATAAIIREDIRSSVVETKSYPPESKMLIKENQEIPKSLTFLTGSHNEKQKRKNS
ncbi:hypothetical protein TNIN_452601 [Trichonephila inaurata madagascariensis]|uniref:Uncharacterized protein n=1 Tax=Trichonephila inaurata madagascariensis TaxID=2747483 RepID=A0A8X6XD66_9ARAC|nr:hypothetical protein TNIN_452601 [Trichonephila inaurata madagascariensis]